MLIPMVSHPLSQQQKELNIPELKAAAQEADCGEEKRYSWEAQVWAMSLLPVGWAWLQHSWGRLNVQTGFGQCLRWVSLTPCPCGRNRGSYSPKAWELGAHGQQLKGKDALGYFGTYTWRFELKSKVFVLLLQKRRQKETFCWLRTWEEISLVLLGWIKIWAL